MQRAKNGQLEKSIMLKVEAESWRSHSKLAVMRYRRQVLGGYGYTRDFPVEQLYR